MKQFKIYGFKNDKPVLITNSNNLSSAATFDETITIQEHMRASGSFKISDKLGNGQPNPFLELIYVGAKIRIVLEDGDSQVVYDAIIKDSSPEFNQITTIYSYSFEDLASVVYSKEGLGLSLEAVGNIRQLLREVLSKSRKNLGYRGLNKNFVVFNKYHSTGGSPTLITENSIKKNFTTESPAVSITYNRSREMRNARYVAQINLLEQIVPSGFTAEIRQLDGNMNIISTTAATGFSPITIPFTLRAGTAYIRFRFSGNNGTTATLTDFNIYLDETQFVNEINQSLKIDPSFDINQFKGKVGELSFYKKVTLKLENSNLYNGLVELAKLYDAEIKFNYITNTVNFLNKKSAFNYKGFKLSPNFNLLTLSRNENINEMSTVLNIVGSGEVFSIFPPVPSEFKQYFADCIRNNFTGTNFFEEYGKTTNAVYNFTTAATYVKANYVSINENIEERYRLIDNFAAAVEQVPNYENTLYSLDYFEGEGKIGEIKLNEFKKIVNDQLRKVNIKLRNYSELYFNAQSTLSQKDAEIDENALRLAAAQINLKILQDEQDALIQEATEDYNEKWIAYENQIVATQDDIDSFKQTIMDTFNIDYDEIILQPISVILETSPTIRLPSDSYTFLSYTVDGFYNLHNNGIRKKIEELEELIAEELNKRAERIARISVIQPLIETVTESRKTDLEVELAGLKQMNENSIFRVGEYEGDNRQPGWYQIKKGYLEFIYNYMSRVSYQKTLIDYSTWNDGSPSGTMIGGATTVLLEENQISTVEKPIQDYMMKLSRGSGGVEYGEWATNTITFNSNKYYRISVIIKVPSNITSGTFSILNNSLVLGSYTFPNLAQERYLVAEYNSQNKILKIYSYPSGELLHTAPAHSGSITSQVIRFRYTGPANTTGILIYRPRIEEITPSIPSLDDIFSLYDNPLMISYISDFSMIIDRREGLYDLLINEAYPYNVNIEKQTIINNLYKNYENYIFEGYYENSEEITNEGLLEQALLAFELSKYPRVDYGVSIIDLSALDNYKFLNINVGDKILISEKEDKMYKGYGSQDTKYLQISEIGYDLRQPDSTSLKVQQDDETRKILQYILKQI